jgi:hypothetical protein
MRERFRLGMYVPALLGGALACEACGGVPHPPFVPQATTALAPIDTPPPPGRVEAIPPRPHGADAWVDGEWVLQHGRWYWMLGRWVTVPPGAKYAPWVVVRAADGAAYYAPSTWHDATGAIVTAPPALAWATASGEAIVDAEGDPEITGRNVKAPRSVNPEATPP